MLARRIVVFMLAMAITVSAAPAEVAEAFMADFFAEDTSGQAVYEDMAIGPVAVHMDGVTYIAYQGWLNDPYVAGYHHDTGRWDGPYKVGDNSLNTSSNPLNTHGAPALYTDRATGHLHVFWGSHGGALLSSRTVRPRDISEWRARTIAVSTGDHAGGVTYPQVVSYETTGGATAVELFYRTANDPTRGWASKVTTGAADTIRVATPTPALEGVVQSGDNIGWWWYATFDSESNGRVHMAAISQPLTGQVRPFERYDVYYAYREPGEQRWRDITGASIGTTESPVPSRENMLASAAQVWNHNGGNQNQVSLAIDGDGRPAIIFLSGRANAVGKDSHDWMFARWDEQEQKWNVGSIAKTDHFFDSATIDFPDADNTEFVEAFLVTGGTRGNGTLDPNRRYEDRGGDIWRYTSHDGGLTWDKMLVRSADPNRGEIYNDPQIVRTDDPSSNGIARLLFCQWDNEADNFINKVFLWGVHEGFAQKEFLPEIRRLSGASRVETAVRVSSESFPLGPPRVPPLPYSLIRRSVFITTGENFADALSGVPLAYASSAPMLFVVGQTLSPAVDAELKRLRATDFYALDVVILGGTAAVSSSIETALRNHLDTRSVRRIDGHDRYEVSKKIALELADKVGKPAGVFVASGENFPDALAAAPVAAAKGYPILLTAGKSLSSQSRSVMGYLGAKSAIVVGGPNAVDPSVVVEIDNTIQGTAQRVSGSDRYATAAAVAEMGLRGVDGDSGVLSMDRFIVASGESYPDALAGGVFAARVRGPVVLTQGSSLHPAARGFLEEYAVEVLDAYVLGGLQAVSPTVFHSVGSILQAQQDEQRDPR